MHLTRPASYLPGFEAQSAPHRLDNILKKKASQGVKVFILVYKEVTFSGLYNNSQHVINSFLNNENIHVMRHPRTVVCFWSHHEKIVCIDQEIGCIGGLDLCFGRWDTNGHPITDYGD